MKFRMLEEIRRPVLQEAVHRRPLKNSMIAFVAIVMAVPVAGCVHPMPSPPPSVALPGYVHRGSQVLRDVALDSISVPSTAVTTIKYSYTGGSSCNAEDQVAEAVDAELNKTSGNTEMVNCNLQPYEVTLSGPANDVYWTVTTSIPNTSSCHFETVYQTNNNPPLAVELDDGVEICPNS